ncbi:MAG: carbamoyl-phosphate synthase, large subunit [Clostridiaceae bacterium]|jgi:carbamoyl-phosphate synthase large subunit|nr:carbamoyl-phosphate synthase, large subunit [Clostridiaceae bacterium]
MSLDKSIKKVIIIGSGPIIIGQAAEFDYSGTQACKSIREEGVETILVNSNPATIMTDRHIADKVYIEPLTAEALEKIIEKERPDGILAGFGGQTALNLAMKLEKMGVLKKYKVRLLGINSESIRKAEDREEFKRLMKEIGQPIPRSIIATTVEQCSAFVVENGFPVIIRPAYTLGGSGGGIANTREELMEICARGIDRSPIGQILLEQSVAGWKEIEYEVIRDSKDNCIVICNMENIDPVGIHTGDSIVVAPSQTLRDREYQMLRQASIDIIRSLKIQGGCNVQFALDPKSSSYIVIEVNPRVSRSSALASKATGYPIAKIASKIALGYTLDELKNYVTGNSSACFEPALDYVVIKIPKLPFDKFKSAEKLLGTQMKATGEVMAISRSFESALMKAVTSLDSKFTALNMEKFSELTKDKLLNKIKVSDDERIFAIAEGFRKELDIEDIYNITKIDKWFLNCIKNIVMKEKSLSNKRPSAKEIYDAKAMGFTDVHICNLTGMSLASITKIRNENNIYPVYKMVDTCSGEFDAATPYYYSCYDGEDEVQADNEKKILVIGSGPIRIGQGVEFDYCSVHGVWAIKAAGYKSIIINNNPETVSTDFDTADKLYFESLYIEDVMNVINKEKPEGVIVQFGGQTAINLAEELENRGIKIFGSSFDSIDLAEDRDKFREFLLNLDIPSPLGVAVTSENEAYEAVKNIGYPVVVRPSYVIGGRGMEVVYDLQSLSKYMKEAVSISSEHPILIDKYIKGTEIEVDAICDGEDILIPGIMEHIERTGVHSGDSITVYPYITLNENTVKILENYTKSIATALNIRGLVNIQYVYDGYRVYVIEVNPRASRTVPILSKVTSVPMVQIAVDIMMGKKLKEMNCGIGLLKNKDFYAVKVPVFSNEKLINADIYLGPEMKSTGEVLGVDKNYDISIFKGFTASGMKVVDKGNVFVSLKKNDRNDETAGIIKKYINLGFKIYASYKTNEFLNGCGVISNEITDEQWIKSIKKGKLNIIINTPSKGNDDTTNGFKLRRMASEYKIPLFTCLDTANLYTKAIMVKNNRLNIEYTPL